MRDRALKVFELQAKSSLDGRDPITPIERALMDVHLAAIDRASPLITAIKKAEVHLLGDCSCETTGTCYHALRDLFLNSGILEDFEERTKT